MPAVPLTQTICLGFFFQLNKKMFVSTETKE